MGYFGLSCAFASGDYLDQGLLASTNKENIDHDHNHVVNRQGPIHS
jgi:hypothetical protein